MSCNKDRRMNQRTAKQAQSPQRSGLPFAHGILQRQCACGQHTPAGSECTPCRRKRESSRDFSDQHAQATVPNLVSDVLRSPGQPLDPATRALMETRFGHEFSAVRVSASPPAIAHQSLQVSEPTDAYEQEAERLAEAISAERDAAPGRSTGKTSAFDNHESKFDLSRVRLHTDAQSAESARALNALAYTVGNDIVFGAGQYQPGGRAGQRLLAHELTHVAQQGAVGVQSAPIIHRQPAAAPAKAPAPAPAAAPAAAAGGMNEEMLKQICRVLHEAMAGLGTDEESIYSALSGRTQEQVDAIARVYLQMYGVALIDELRDELSDSEMEHLAIFSPTAGKGAPGSAEQAASFADLTAAQLDKAMKGLGTDEDSIYAALSGRTQAELQAIKQAYKRRTGRELEADIRDEMSGSELNHALALLNQGMLLPEDEVYLAVTGLGTDEDTLFRVLETVKGDRAKITALIDKYAAKGYGDMLADIRDDLSGAELARAMEILHGQTTSGTCSAKQRQQGLEAISTAVSMAQTAVAKADVDVAKGQLSSAVESALKNNFNPGKAPNAVNIGLLTSVRTVLNSARTDLLSLSQVNCGAVAPCVTDPDCSHFTAAWTTRPAGSLVQLCPAFFSCSSNQAEAMLHEFVHHIGIADQFYSFAPEYSSLTPLGNHSKKDSLDNADSYAHFASDLF